MENEIQYQERIKSLEAEIEEMKREYSHAINHEMKNIEARCLDKVNGALRDCVEERDSIINQLIGSIASLNYVKVYLEENLEHFPHLQGLLDDVNGFINHYGGVVSIEQISLH